MSSPAEALADTPVTAQTDTVGNGTYYGKPVPLNRKHLKPAWKPGDVPNPAGRAVGSRNRITESFLADLHATWQEGGIAALRTIMADDPATYCRIAASIIPKQSAHIRANITQSRPLDAINADLIQAVRALGYDVQPVAGQAQVIDCAVDTGEDSPPVGVGG